MSICIYTSGMCPILVMSRCCCILGLCPHKMDEPMLMNFGAAPSVALFGKICPKMTGTTLLGPRRDIPSCFSVFPGPFRPDLPETDWDDTPI